MVRFLWLNAYDSQGKSYLFSAPKEILVFSGGDPGEFFRRLEEALSRGFFAAGFFTYEFGYFLEKRLFPFRKRRPQGVPLAWFGIFDPPEPFRLTGAPEIRPVKIENLGLTLTEEAYRRAILRIKDYIASGDTYQVNYTLKYRFDFSGRPKDLFLRLLRKQRVRYAALLEAEDFSVVSLSPELFLERRGLSLTSSPMKGTAPRRALPEEDEALARFLTEDPKSRAENVMIVDLIRNDLGRVCEPGSVFVPELFKVERYRTVHQMISTVSGTLRKDTGLYEIFRALFPCGSVTGAPKIRTMEIIAELEPEPRGVYTGAVGWIAPSGDFLFNVAIRTVVLHEEGGEFGIGSGVVWDSDPGEEWRECLLKARFLTEEPPEFSLVETLRLEKGKLARLERHLRRLKRSAAHFVLPFPETRIRERLKELSSGLPEKARVRILLSEWGEVSVEAGPLTEFPQPVKVGLMRRDFSPDLDFLLYKTTHRPWYEAARKRAQALGLSEIVFYDEAGRLTEGTITNVFLEINGKLYTPPKTLGLLPGILREELLETGQAEEREITLSDLLTGRLFIGNSARGLIPVEAIYFL
ncbi:aminodeoxychorismate synthase component I [Thermosulfurimonas sp.]|uniref:aminodeoxychorismate synthase component I n=1 Tax=Thermosulfurimonas sp. TaxID=2080236 RepID=UPI0025F9F86A|nr:aminodeoxychorismate synthase component I [Thermosulfurimonas sp.]